VARADETVKVQITTAAATASRPNTLSIITPYPT
jgi:hypothetical protein